MSVVKVIEVLAQSKESWDDAARQAVREASQSVHGITSVYIKEMQAIVENDQIVEYRVNAKISFKVERQAAE